MRNNMVAEIELSYTPEYPFDNHLTITSSLGIYELFRTLFDQKLLTVKEECIALFLNRANKITGWYKVSSGGITGTVVDIRLILSIALKSLSCSIVIAHTHPSGNLKPSRADIDLTERLKETARLFDIALLDHLIITMEGYHSFADKGLI